MLSASSVIGFCASVIRTSRRLCAATSASVKGEANKDHGSNLSNARG